MIHIAKRSDLPLISKHIELTVCASYPAIYGSKVINFFLQYHKLSELQKLFSESHFLFIPSDKGSEIGLMACGCLKKNEIRGVYVHPNHQKMGWGTMLVKALIHRAKIEDRKHLWLEATPMSVKLYQKLGFIIEEEPVMYIDNEPLAYAKMVLQL